MTLCAVIDILSTWLQGHVAMWNVLLPLSLDLEMVESSWQKHMTRHCFIKKINLNTFIQKRIYFFIMY